MPIDTKEIVVTTNEPAVKWENVEQARLAYEQELRSEGKLEPGEFVKIVKHRIVKKNANTYEVYVTFQTEMGPGAPPVVPGETGEEEARRAQAAYDAVYPPGKGVTGSL